MKLDAVAKRFGATAAIDGVSLEIARGEFFALLGPSGCGKTTLMRIVAGFEAPDAGRVMLEGRDLAGEPPHRRPINMVFQSYALFPHMNVEDNIAFGLKQEGMKRTERAKRIDEMLALTQLEPLRRRRPEQLSGGQRQRVALARALAKRPRLLLLDEPLAALDRKLREETQFELRRVQRALGASFVLVTHDQDEAMGMADRIAVMRDGRIEQVGAPREVYDRPASRWIGGFIGDINLFEATALADVAAGAPCDVRLAIDASTHSVCAAAPLRSGGEVALGVRPEFMTMARVAPPMDVCIGGEIVDVIFRGDTILARVRLDNGDVARVARANQGRADLAPPGPGDRVYLSFKPGDAVVLTA